MNVTAKIYGKNSQEYFISKPKTYLLAPVLQQIIMGPLQVEVLGPEKQ